MNRIIHPLFENPSHEYKCKYSWPSELHVQGNDNIVIPGNVILYSFEIFMNDLWFCGRGKTVAQAEEDAWETWKIISDCDHRIFVTSEHLEGQGSICVMCGIFKRDENCTKGNLVS